LDLRRRRKEKRCNATTPKKNDYEDEK